MQNVLVTSIGSLSAPFVLKTLVRESFHVTGIDIYPEKWIAAARYSHSFYTVPAVSEIDAYRRSIGEIIEKNKIDIILPLTDFDVDFWATQNNVSNSTDLTVAFAKPQTIVKVRNKAMVYKDLKDTKIRCIPTSNVVEYDQEIGLYPCIAKKTTGRSSENQYIFYCKDDLNTIIKKKNDYIVQPYLKGEVIAVDVLFNHNEIIHIARRELTRTANGAGIAVQIIQSDEITELLKEFIKLYAMEGCFNIEFLNHDSTLYLMDINPRFSAGVAFSDMAGYNFVKNHMNYFCDRPTEKINAIAYNQIYTREYQEISI